MTRIEFDRVHKAFDAKAVLQGLSLSLAAGESLALIGRSGSGKSVTLRCLLGLLHPDAGHIYVDGQQIATLRGPALQRHRSRIGMLFQNAALFDSLPVWHNVAFRLLEQGMRTAQAREKAVALLALVDLSPDAADLSPADLSGGMQKRVGLARALAGDPDILLFDEPTTGLDPISAAHINTLIAQVRAARGATALTITHDLDSARRIADRIALLHGGQIVWTGTPAALEGDPHPALRQFVDGNPDGPLTQQSVPRG